MYGSSGPTRPRTSRAANMSARQRRSELAAIIANGIARAIAARTDPARDPEEPAVDGLALSADLRLSVPLAGPTARAGRASNAGEQA